MSAIPSALPLCVLLAGLLAVLLARGFRDLELDVRRWIREPLLAGLIAGLLGYAVHAGTARHLATGVAIGAAIAWLRHGGNDPDPVAALALGSVVGAGAAIPPLFAATARDPFLESADLLATGAIGWMALAFAGKISGAPRIFRGTVAVAASGATAVLIPRVTGRIALEPITLLAVAASIAPLALIVQPLVRWKLLKRELAEEAELGVLPEGEVAGIAHPIRRMGRAGWLDRQTRAAFVRCATELALRRRLMRRRDSASARLHQLEILKLRARMRDLLEMQQPPDSEFDPGHASDTMTAGQQP